MQYIEKIKLINFRRFRNFEVTFNGETNTIIGDNESGKSSIIQAIEMVSSGSRNKVEAIGIESILNKEAIKEFFSAYKAFENLPEIHVEAYLADDSNPDLVGRNNTETSNSSGLHMICCPNEDLAGEINEILSEDEENFPFEYYLVKFITFNGDSYSGYRRFLRCLTIDSSQINSEHANKEYIRSVYESTVDHADRTRLKNEYRQKKNSFVENNLRDINENLGDYDFTVRSGSKFNLETDLALAQDQIPINERGKGKQCFIKTEFALSKNVQKRAIDVLLLEEPENHLSHSNMRRLISKISESHERQIIIATHNSLISSRLDLRNSILMNFSSDTPVTLNDLSSSTAKFFMKAPDNNILEFVLSEKVILVEGDAEYMLLDAMYSRETGRTLDQDAVHVISVGGTSFKRYMELGRELGNKVAVVRDNDRDYQGNCVDNYEEYTTDNIKVFSDEDSERYTFEVCVYDENKAICDDLFSGGSIVKAPLNFMLDNKTEAAFRLVEERAEQINIPDYIREAILWINA